MAGFFARRAEGGHNSGEQRHILIKNSATVTLGDAFNVETSGTGTFAGVGERVLGVVEGFVDKNGLPLVAQHATGSDYTMSGNPGVVGSETVAVASDNATDSMVKAVVNIDASQEYYNDADEDLDLTDDWQYFDVTSGGDVIDASTVSTTGQFVLVERDPDRDGDLSKGLFRIAEHALYL